MSRGYVCLLSNLLFIACVAMSNAKAQEAAACSGQQLANWCSRVPSTAPPSCANCPKTYIVHSYQGRERCLDYTPEKSGSPIIINECAKSHPIVVEELADGKHTVVLHAGTKVIGIKIKAVNTMGNRGGGSPAPSTAEIPLQLLDWDARFAAVPAMTQNHFFSLDGDSILLASERSLVAKVQNARGATGSPVVLGPRQLGDNEFWDFAPTGRANSDPTTGFVRIGYNGDPNCATPGKCVCRLFNVVSAAKEGTVVKLGTSLDLTDCPALNVGQGVTIRGDRRGTSPGPQLNTCYVVDGVAKCDSSQSKATEIEPMIMLTEGANDVRITGLRLHGPSRSTDQNQTNAIGVISFEANQRNIVDHNDVSDWPYIGVMTKAHDDKDIPTNSKCDPRSVNDPQTRPTTAFVARNFIHHNLEEEAGYGTETDWGAYPFVFGNTFVSNRHAIAGGKGSAHTGYRAWYNLVLSAAPLQHDIFHTHDFDMHGLGDNGFGGIGGDYIDIYGNTFFGTNRHNFELRGDTCNYAEFHNNISLESKDDAVNWKTCPNVCWASAASPSLFRISDNPNQFGHANPTSGTTALGVGDFDGDGGDDLFLATGEAWYYSPAGKAEWRFLSAKTDTRNEVLLGDFDGDGRTDVVAIHDGKFVVSWGGVSEWEVLNANPTGGRLLLLPSAVSAMAVGDFDGNKIADVFWADGQTWWVSYGGNTVFKEVQTSSFHMSDLRLGDFNGDGRTDVFGVSNTSWEVSYAPKTGQGLFSSWQTLRPRLTDSANGVVVADFNGDGYADVATDCSGAACWRISYQGTQNWTNATQPVTLSGDFAGVGHFRGVAPTDVLTWNNSGKCDNSHGQGTQLCISVAGIERAAHYSTQDMR